MLALDGTEHLKYRFSKDNMIKLKTYGALDASFTNYLGILLKRHNRIMNISKKINIYSREILATP